jgi:hypothetical protein
LPHLAASCCPVPSLNNIVGNKTKKNKQTKRCYLFRSRRPRSRCSGTRRRGRRRWRCRCPSSGTGYGGRTRPRCSPARPETKNCNPLFFRPKSRSQSFRISSYSDRVVVGKTVFIVKTYFFLFFNALGYSWRCKFLQRWLCNMQMLDWLQVNIQIPGTIFFKLNCI